MGDYSNEIRDACALLGYTCTIVDSDETLEIYTSVEARYADFGKPPLWERLRDDLSIYDPDGWGKIADFTRGEVIFIFFNRRDDNEAVRLEDGTHLTEILGECIPFVFYVTNENQDYLLGFNDHDFLMGAGTAKAFIQKLRASRSSD